MIISTDSKRILESPKIISSVMKNKTQNKVKMDPEKAPAPVKKLIEAAQDDLMERECLRQYIEESSDGTFVGPESPEQRTEDRGTEFVKVAGSWVAKSSN